MRAFTLVVTRCTLSGYKSLNLLPFGPFLFFAAHAEISNSLSSIHRLFGIMAWAIKHAANRMSNPITDRYALEDASIVLQLCLVYGCFSAALRICHGPADCRARTVMMPSAGRQNHKGPGLPPVEGRSEGSGLHADAVSEAVTVAHLAQIVVLCVGLDTFGGQAVAELLLGRFSPSGWLLFTW